MSDKTDNFNQSKNFLTGFTEQKIRGLLFYLSVLVFLGGLPFILSFALGYKINWHNFKFTRAGMIVIKTQPAGANVYFNDTLFFDKSPVTINELLPGKYQIRLELEGHYEYEREVQVEAGKVSLLDKVMLFPLRQDIKQLNKEKLDTFFADENKGIIYYVNQEESIIYKSDFNGAHFEVVSNFIPILPLPKGWRISHDKEKLLYFNNHQIGIMSLVPHDVSGYSFGNFVMNYPSDVLHDIFWYSDSYHLILVTSSKIEITEAVFDSLPVILVNLTKRNTPAYYDLQSDALYFMDYQKAADGNLYDNLYKVELGKRLNYLKDFMKIKTNE